MEIASPLLDIVKGLWGLASKPLGYVYNLKDNVHSLDEANKKLKAVMKDVKARVKRDEEEARGQCTSQVGNWLGKVQNFVSGVDQFLREVGERDQINCLSRWLPRYCWSSYKLGKRVDQLLNEARQLQHEKGELTDFTLPLPPPPVIDKPMDETVGLDISLNEVWKWLVDEKEIRVIGLYGLGGVGKTTLMKRINEKLKHANHEFEIVIWVEVNKQVGKGEIQDAIKTRLHIHDESWKSWSQDERINHLSKVLIQKKFVLLIDNVWAMLGLPTIGVSDASLKNGSKVVFTTRSKQVCHQMKADKIYEVQCLKSEEALTLFEKKVDKLLKNCQKEIQDLAKDIVEECKGLPLALITVGRAMASREHPNEWHHALKTLKNKPHELEGMEDMYRILEFSYDSLKDPTIQLCFLYCCLFPEGYPIGPHNLIELWIGEGLLEDTNGVYCMRVKGEYFLGTLKMACLLETAYDHFGRPCVKMHDVIRDMATWIARDRGQRENKLLVIEKEEDMSANMILKWREAEKVSLWGTMIQNIDRTPPRCPWLKTLIIRETNVRLVPRGFFYMKATHLAMLDLSDNKNIELFPEEICSLNNLQVLNLSGTRIIGLPKEIKNLTCLRWLLLNDIIETFLIPTGAIASLPLNVFSMWRSGLEKEEEMIEELGCMENLIDLSIRVHKSFSTLKIFQSLHECIRRVEITYCKDLTHILISHSKGHDSHLEVLHLYNCPKLVKMEITQEMSKCTCFHSLVDVQVSKCGFLELSWLVHAPNIRILAVCECNSMEKIIGDGFAKKELDASRSFSRLESIKLYKLPKLRSICDQTLCFQGASFEIWRCRGLIRLPLDSNCVREGFSIYGDKDWWDNFKWDPAARVTFQWKYQPVEEEMSYEEAVQKMSESVRPAARFRFLPLRAE